MISFKKVFSANGSKFYLLFDEVANNLVNMVNIFTASIHEDNAVIRRSQLVQLFELEERNDFLTHKLFIELGKNFITPFDREDIHALISTLDDIADYLYATMKQINNYGIIAIPHPTKNVANNLQKLIKSLAEVIKRLQDKRNLDQLYPLCVEIKKMANLCTSLTDAAVSRIYMDEPGPIEAIKRLDHFELVHTLVDKCSTVVNVVESIIIKYS